MGKLIQCSSVIASEPYCFPMTKTRVYSIEEVCYYIRNNIYMMQEEIFDQEFADWLRQELGMEVTADKLERMRRDHNNLKDIVVTLCCSCDYYTEPEINRLIDIMDETQNLPPRGRQKIKADSFLKSGRLEKARREYEGILKSPDMLNATQEEYGAVYGSLGAAYAGMGEFRQAANAFQKAYEQGRETKSMQSYLYCLRLGDFEEEYRKAAKELELTTEQRVFLEAQYEDAVRQGADCRQSRQIKRLRAMREKNQPEVHEAAGELIAQWKKEYRESIRRV